jgi:phage terminase small subunit
MSNEVSAPAPRSRAVVKLKRDEAVRRLCRKIVVACPWITPADGPTVRAWCQFERLALEAYERLRADGLMRSDGTPHPLLGELTKLRRAQVQLGSQLGIGPRARSEVASSSRTMPLDIDLDRVETVNEQN